MKKNLLVSVFILLITICRAQYPIASFSVDDTAVCPGTCTNFLNQSLNSTSYFWSFAGANPSSSTTANPQNICYNTPGFYSVTLIASNSMGSDTLTWVNCVHVNPYPPPLGLMNHGDTLFDPNQLFVHYQWYLNGILIPGDTLYWHVAMPDGWHTTIATDSNGCEVEPVDFGFPVDPNFITSDTEFCAGSCINMVNMTQPSIDTTVHQWHFYGASPSTSLDWNPQNICYNSAGTFMIKLVMLNSLHSYSDSFIVNVLPCTGISENSFQQFSVSPNPFNDRISLSFNNPHNSTAFLKIFNSIGEAVLEKEISLEDQTLELTSLPQGIYLFTLMINDEIFLLKIIK